VAGLEGGERLPLSGGDIVIFPHGDAHVLSNGAVVGLEDIGRQLHQVLSQGLKVARAGGGGEVTRFVCGYLACDPQLSRALLAGLPPALKVTIRDDGAGNWLENTIRFSVAETGATRAGGEAVLAKLSEAVFVETLRRYVAQLPEDQTGWLAGARDRDIGQVLTLMHRSPAHPWTLVELARAAGVSRSVLAERFRHFLGEPPMTYLTRWRMLLSSRWLKTSSRSVAEIAAEAGYESEAAFNRAFKREFGTPPARFRSESRVGGAARPSPGAAGEHAPEGPPLHPATWNL
jgi:AraC-like DNA-binding protein